MQSRSVYDFLSAEKQHKKNCVYRFTNIDSQHHIPKNLVSSFDSVTSIIFCVNIADYDQGLRANKLVQSIDYFDSVINQPCFWPQDTSVVLLLTHMDEFREKLADSPLGEHFPDFRGGCDVKQAEEYVIGRFRQVNRKDLFLDHHTTHLVTLGDIELIFKEINGQYMWKILAGSGIL